MEKHVLSGKPRAEFGSRAATRLRDEGLLPANIYGHGQDNQAFVLESKDFRRFFEAGHRVAKIQIDGQTEEHGVVKEVQYDSLGSDLLHVDFSRIDPHEKIAMEVPIETIGVAKGVSSGGHLEQPLHELRIEGPADKIPESFPITVSELGLEDAIRLKDLEAPAGCAILGDPDSVVLVVHAARDDTASAEGGGSEPEVIGRKEDEAGDD